ncbi:MAG: hypothetical protein CL758_08925 [Chloroflexi bacterium]|nr:hypothetical protein [Chloroflexota bacterium]|tara:strand:- start:15475 stop:16251 length:777 start_codon:yes stop_codon:yes gene_type:complete
MKFKYNILLLIIIIIFSFSCASDEIDANLDNNSLSELPNQDLTSVEENKLELKVDDNVPSITYTDESETFSFDIPAKWRVVTSMAQLFDVFKDSLNMQSSIAPVLFGIDQESGDNIFVTLEFTELYQDKPQIIDIDDYTAKEVEKLTKVLFQSEEIANENIIQSKIQLDDGSYGNRIEIYHTEVPLLQILYVLINPTENGWCGSLPFMFTGSISSEEGNEINLIQINKILNSFKIKESPPQIDCNKRETLSILKNTYD